MIAARRSLVNLDDGLMHTLSTARGPSRERAFEELVARHAPGLTAFTRRLTDDPGRAEDVVQETFLRLYQARERYEPNKGATFQTWLYRIARNLALNTRRRERRRRSRRLEEAAAPPASRPDPLTKLIASRDVAAIQAAIGALDPRDQEVLSLRFHQGLTYAEVADVVGATSPAAVKQRAFRALKKLRERFEGEGA